MRWVRLVLLLGLLASTTTTHALGQERPPGAEPSAPTFAAPPGPAAPVPAATADQAPAAAAADEADVRWVATHKATDLWSDSDAGISFGTIRPFTYLQLTGQVAGSRLYVYNPRTQNYAWVDSDAVGPVPAPPAAYFNGPQVVDVIGKPGRVVGGFNLRSWPAVRDDTLLRPLAHNAPLFVEESVVGDDGEIWYRVGDDEYVHSSGVRLPKPPPQVFSGRGIDVDRTEPAMLAAY